MRAVAPGSRSSYVSPVFLRLSPNILENVGRERSKGTYRGLVRSELFLPRRASSVEIVRSRVFLPQRVSSVEIVRSRLFLPQRASSVERVLLRLFLSQRVSVVELVVRLSSIPPFVNGHNYFYYRVLERVQALGRVQALEKVLGRDLESSSPWGSSRVETLGRVREFEHSGEYSSSNTPRTLRQM